MSESLAGKTKNEGEIKPLQTFSFKFLQFSVLKTMFILDEYSPQDLRPMPTFSANAESIVPFVEGSGK